MVKPRDAHRYGYRLWADRASGLLLRADVLGERGEVLEIVGLLRSLDRRASRSPRASLQPMKKLDGYRIVRPALTPHPARGRRLGDARRLRRAFARSAASAGRWNRRRRGRAPSAAPVLQTIYSDGLTYVSVFIEPLPTPSATPSRCSSALGATVDLTPAAGRLVGHRGRRRAAGDAQDICCCARAQEAVEHGCRVAKPHTSVCFSPSFLDFDRCSACIRSSTSLGLRRRVATASAPLALSLSLVATAAPQAAQRAGACPTSPTWSRRSGPAVVNIRTTERARAGARRRPEMDEDMQEFFRRFWHSDARAGRVRARQQPAARRRSRSRAASARASSSAPTAT